jgi:hypothetical protein
MSNGSQVIFGGTVAPDAGALLIDFKTVRPAKPIFTVWRNLVNVPEQDMVPANQVALAGETFGGNPTTDHSKRIAGLPQGVPLWLRIDANAEDLPHGDPQGVANWVLGTGTFARVCLVKILSVQVLNSGDSGGDADMVFEFQVYNGSNSMGEGLIGFILPGPGPQNPIPRFDRSGVDNGEFVPDMVSTFRINNAPDVVVPFLASLHLKGGFLHFPTIGTNMVPDTVPDGAGSGSNDDFEFATCMGLVTLPTQLGDTSSDAFIMSTGLAVPSITATLVFETKVSNPANILPEKLIHLVHFPGFG